MEAEHGIEGVEGDRWIEVCRVRGGGSDEGGSGSGFVDALFEKLPFLRLFVLHQHLVINRFVQLSFRVIDAEFGKEWVHTKRARFIRDDGDHTLTEGFVLHQRAKHTNESHRRRDFHASFGTLVKISVGSGLGQNDVFGRYHALWHWTAKRCTALIGVSHEFRDIFRHDIGIRFEVFVGKR